MDKLQRVTPIFIDDGDGHYDVSSTYSEAGDFYDADQVDEVLKQMVMRLWVVINDDSRIRKEVVASIVADYLPSFAQQLQEELKSDAYAREKMQSFGDRYGVTKTFLAGSVIEVKVRISPEAYWEDQPTFEMNVPMVALFSTLQQMADMSAQAGKPVYQFRWNHKGSDIYHFWIPGRQTGAVQGKY